VINNNQWAISVNIDKQTATKTLAQKAIAAGIEGIQVDGNDILAMRETIGDAIAKARNKQGPTLIEALTYRLSDHTTADDATRYQPPAELRNAAMHEPILRFKKYLENHLNWSLTDEESLIAKCEEDIEAEVNVYLNREKQPVNAIFDYHYAELPEYLIEQRAIAMEVLND
jgi:pyruvate dehydrogenase E1 component alpha subunit